MKKQAIILRDDLQLPIGKACSQAAHASLEAAHATDDITLWREQGQKKVVLKAKDLKQLQQLQENAERNDLTTAMVRDAGETVTEPGTITALAIGPASEEKIDKVTSHLSLL